ncbi:hypothetical protein EVAR_76612_1 [Eumeta japonica]|uniref:Uncharacterized protein n=1 Tax=Eumeta variegata TaxID=151549 RepID=A0A4C1T5F3_EUMVA|nr:hypothetical protein EVAR_76612_1 [Eumeta japonica]
MNNQINRNGRSLRAAPGLRARGGRARGGGVCESPELPQKARGRRTRKKKLSEFFSPDSSLISQFDVHCPPNRGVIKGDSSIFLLSGRRYEFSYSISTDANKRRTIRPAQFYFGRRKLFFDIDPRVGGGPAKVNMTGRSCRVSTWRVGPRPRVNILVAVQE